MVTKVVMPRLSLTMKTGTVVQWFKKEGETVQKGEPLVEVLSEKVTYDVEAPASGLLRRILAMEGTDVPVAEAIGIITVPDEQISDSEIVTKGEVEAKEAVSVPEKETLAEAEERFLASPAARRLAREHGVTLTQVKGSGPDGRIVEEDVKRFIDGTTKLPRVKEIIPLTGIRKTTAQRVSLSAQTAPHSTITMEVDATNVLSLHKEAQLSYTDMLVKAAAQALREQPIMNATLDGERIKVFEDINVGVAVATDKGLVVPVVRDADQRSLSELASVLNELVEKARTGKLVKEDITGGTFTVTNLGMYGVDVFIPIINPPETAILGAGKVSEKPVAVNGQVTIQPRMQLSLSYDHRIVDGAPAATFLYRVKQILESSNVKEE